jgi:inner membrane protein
VGANFFFVWCGLSAVVVGFCKLAMPALTWEIQFAIFGIGLVASLFVWRYYRLRSPQSEIHSTLNRRGQQYLGRVFTLQEAIVNGMGKVRVEDTTWRVQGPDLPVGTKVRVVDVDGVILKVEQES